MPCWCKGKCPHIEKPQQFLNRKNTRAARLALRNSLIAAPLCVEGNLLLASVLATENRPKAAMVHVERAAQNASPARIHFERGRVLRQDMKLDAAREEFYKALQAAPENPNVAAGLVGALEMAGLLEEAKAVCEAARTKFPAHLDLRRLAAVIADAQGDTIEAEKILSRPGEPELMPVEILDRGRYLDKLGRHAEAWELWDQAKTVLRLKFGQVYNQEFADKNFAALRESANPPRPNFYRGAPDLDMDPSPLFVCGFPRSGTTMTEQILSAHSAVIAGDELMGLNEVIEAMPAWLKVRAPYPACMLAMSLGENTLVPEMLRDLYIKSAQERIGFKRMPQLWRRVAGTPAKQLARRKPWFFTDKMCLNELHLPLLRLLFPAAPVLRLQRHPLDVMVSCLSNWLPHGGFYASSLEACARHYRAVDETVQHYERQFAIADRRGLTTIRYESLVADQENATTELLGAAGLALEPACLAFHKNKRPARTLSYRQVQQPLNTKGAGRWKNYRDQLAPAVEILRPILEREGYDF